MMPASLGLRIKEARKAAKMMQVDLARKLEKSLRTVQKYESGEILPSVEMLSRISDILNVPLTELLADTPSKAVLQSEEPQQMPPAPPLENQMESLSEYLSLLSQYSKELGFRLEITIKKPDDPKDFGCVIFTDGLKI